MTTGVKILDLVHSLKLITKKSLQKRGLLQYTERVYEYPKFFVLESKFRLQNSVFNLKQMDTRLCEPLGFKKIGGCRNCISKDGHNMLEVFKD